MRVVGRAALERPLLHRVGDLVGEGRIERLAGLQGLVQAGERVLGEPFLLDRGGEDVARRRGSSRCREGRPCRWSRRWRSSSPRSRLCFRALVVVMCVLLPRLVAARLAPGRESRPCIVAKFSTEPYDLYPLPSLSARTKSPRGRSPRRLGEVSGPRPPRPCSHSASPMNTMGNSGSASPARVPSMSESSTSNDPYWREAMAPYARPVFARSLLDIFTSVVPFLALWALMFMVFDDFYWLVLLISIPAAGFPACARSSSSTTARTARSSRLAGLARRCRLSRFPYELIYQIRGELWILILAVASAAERDPPVWKSRLGRRLAITRGSVYVRCGPRTHRSPVRPRQRRAARLLDGRSRPGAKGGIPGE